MRKKKHGPFRHQHPSGSAVAKFRSQVLKRADIDPIYLCEELKACPAGRDDAAGSVRGTAVSPLVERFVRRGTEPFELFRSEFGQDSVRMKEILLEFNSIYPKIRIFQHFLQGSA